MKHIKLSGELFFIDWIIKPLNLQSVCCAVDSDRQLAVSRTS